MREIWKDIKGYEGIYQISNFGRLKSLKKNIIKKPSMAGRGYYRIALSKERKIKYEYIHRLVAQTFIPNLDNSLVVNHKDENKLNNCVDNLEWVTNKENINYGKHNFKKNMSLVIHYLKINYPKEKEIINQLEDIKEKIIGI